jgi:hypothetical protein
MKEYRDVEVKVCAFYVDVNGQLHALAVLTTGTIGIGGWVGPWPVFAWG